MTSIEIAIQTIALILTALIVVYQKFNGLRRNEVSNFYYDLKPQGKKLLFATIVLIILQMISLFFFNNFRNKLSDISENVNRNKIISEKLLLESRPNLLIHKNKINWFKNNQGQESVRICLINMGCRNGSVTNAEIRFHEIEEGYKSNYTSEILNPKYEWQNLVNKKLDIEKCCVAFTKEEWDRTKYDNEILQLVIQLTADYIDDTTKDTFQLFEQYYYDGSTQLFKKGLPERMLQEVNSSTNSVPNRIILK